jgi:hypothetical protein
MNKKEVAEIKKQFTPDRNTITRICGCYVDGEKNIRFTAKDAFHSIPDEDAFKYFSIFKHTLSGTLGKNLLNMEFPLEQELEGGTQEFLLRLRNSKLQDDALTQEFYEKVIENYTYPENYYIILIHVAYDVPGKASDGLEMDDASDTVFEYLLCSICPVKLSKAALGYNAEKNCIEDRIRDWVVDNPATGFMFPVFNDRATDIHSVLYFTKNPEEEQENFTREILGAAPPMSAGIQKETFHTLLTETLGEDCNYEVMRTIHDSLNEMIEEHKDEPEPLALTKNNVVQLLEETGVSNEKIETFEQEFVETIGDKSTILATNIAETRKFNIETPDVVIKVNPERTDLIETRMIDGKQCIVIAVDDHIQVNGVNVRTLVQNPENETDSY